MRGVTLCPLVLLVIGPISTHTPHARRDALRLTNYSKQIYFNSHASCEA